MGIIHKKPAEGGISAVGGTGSIYTFYGPDEPKFANLTSNFLTKDIDKIMPAREPHSPRYSTPSPPTSTCAPCRPRPISADLGRSPPRAVGLDEPIPLWWTTDFILASPVGTPSEQEKWIVGEFNCSCVGISKCLPAYCKPDTPTACWDDIPPDDQAEAMYYGNMMGMVALDILRGAQRSCAPALGLLGVPGAGRASALPSADRRSRVPIREGSAT